MPLARSDLEPFLRLALVQGVGPQRLATLLERFGGPDSVIRAPARALREVPGIGEELARRIRGAAASGARARTARAIAALDRAGAVALTSADPLYPAAFRRVAEPPVLLYCAGDLSLLAREGVAVVGTRKPTHYGRRAAERLGFDLAFSGLTVISGVARGIDAAAHRGALHAGGATVGILGHGIEQVYPPEAARLFREIRERGLLVTEFPPGETPKAGNFPRRNRLITALARAVIVVEMAHRSGAQHTVGFALEQGKEVMAVPGPIDSPASEGTNQLIKDGARLVASADDVLEELLGVGWKAGREAPPEPPVTPARVPPEAIQLPLLSEEETGLLRRMGSEPLHVDDLATESGGATSAILATLLRLELRGLVAALPGKRFCLAEAPRVPFGESPSSA